MNLLCGKFHILWTYFVEIPTFYGHTLRANIHIFFCFGMQGFLIFVFII